MKEFYQELEAIIRKTLRLIYPEREFSFSLEIPRNKKFGDLTLTLPLKLSSELKQPPLKIAEGFKDKLESLLLEGNPGIERIEVVSPGFVNFFLKDSLVKELFLQVLEDKENFFKEGSLRDRKILIEFVSANPTGPLSIAHGRGAIIGDVLASVYSFLGAEVVREYYINDEGTQIDLFVASVRERIKELKGEPFQIPEGGYQGDYVREIAKKILEEGREDLTSSALKVVLEEIRKDLLDLGIEFDSWISQTQIRREGKIQEVIDFLNSKGLTYEKDSALWFKSSLFGDDKDRVLVRGDGTFTYFSADGGYHKYKIERGFTELINLWGPDHHGYVKRLSSVLEVFRQERNFNYKIIIFQLVSLKSKEKVSKRKGTIIFLKDLVREVGKDGVRFYYLLRKNSSHLEFDIDKALKRNFENPLYYIQYAYARICSIIEKHKEKIDFKNIYLLKDKEEISLMKKVLEFKNVLNLIYQEAEPYYLIDYLKSLASEFHLFYEKERVLIEDDPELTQARLSLILGVKIVLSLGLSLLKLTAPSKM
ncbi:MAG: arginine--tRNA ligase [Candidatus Omnitrophica bacterium]|nr:arginine--tRNA ligase [Candidatus Omnitrophota bacterium]